MAHLFIKFKDRDDLSAATRRLMLDLGIQDYQTRYSSNYVGESYIRANSLGFKITLAQADEDEVSDGYLWLALDSLVWFQERSYLDYTADYIARYLTAIGYSVVRPEAFGVIGGRWITYELRDQDGIGKECGILVEFKDAL